MFREPGSTIQTSITFLTKLPFRWDLSENRLSYLNPYLTFLTTHIVNFSCSYVLRMKMKSSILLGVSQMFFGVMLSLLNYTHHHSVLDILFVFIPQLLFLSLIFVYLCVQVSS